MKILLTNDDGIHAPGMDAMCEALGQSLKGRAEICVVAPTEERSACGHGITLKDPLRIMQFERNDGIGRFAINGTPADCVKMAVNGVLPWTPDVVFSGINLGPNLGINVIYSGTVAGAVEASLQGIPAIAVSLVSFRQSDFSLCKVLVSAMAEVVLERKIDIRRMLLNVNVPPVSLDQVRGVQATTQGISKFIEDFSKREDAYGRPYYWMAGDKEPFVGPDHSDEKCVEKRWVSITPLQYDLTDYRCLPYEHASREPFPLDDFLRELKPKMGWN